MFGIGIPEILVILVIALIVIGPEKLPEIAKLLGKTVAELKKAIDGVKTSMEEEKAKTVKAAGIPPEASLDEARKRLEKEYEELMGESEPVKEEAKETTANEGETSPEKPSTRKSAAKSSKKTASGKPKKSDVHKREA